VGAALLGTVFGATNDILAILSAAICLAMGLQLLELVDLPLLSVKEVSKTFAAVSNTSDKDKNKDQPILLNASGQILNDKDENTPNGSLWRTFFLGGSSALVASPCATPVLTSILAYVATAQNAALGFALLLTYTLGYATPLLYIAATGGQALVDLKNSKGIYSQLGPWVTPITGGVLLGYGMNGLLTTLLGDPSLVALAPVFE
jgi:cytochrome c-type biogenesis protein